MAGERLQSHIRQFGARSREVREWTLAQDKVFSNCDGSGLLPQPAPADIHPVIRRDRDYQVAAAYFSGGRFEEAEKAFRRIPRDPSWPGGLWAPYMVGRSLLWQARIAQDDALYRAKLHRAQVHLEAVLQRDDLAPTHNAARYLLLRILIITGQEAASRLLGVRLMSPLRTDSRFQDLSQYFQLLDNAGGLWKPRDGLTDWILTFQRSGLEAREHAYARWRESGSVAWLVAALRHARADDAIVPELLEAASQLAASPGWATVRYYQARLLAEREQYSDARRVLDALPPSLAGRPSSANRVAALRLKFAETFEEAMRFGLRKPAGFGTNSSSGRTTSLWGAFSWGDWMEATYGPMPDREMLHPELADALNASVPLERFSRMAVESEDLPQWLRQEFVLTAWTRAVVLERWDLARTLAEQARSVVPAAAASMDEFLAAPPESRILTAQLVLLRFPGIGVAIRSGVGRNAPLEALQLDGLNWWWWKDRYETGEFGPSPQKSNGWTTAQERAQAAQEWKQILALGEGHDWLYAGILQHCDKESPPPACSEALYRAGVSQEAIGFWHDPAWLDLDVDGMAYRAGPILQLYFPRTVWAQRFVVDVEWAEKAWQSPDREYGSRPYVRYPR